MFQTVETRISDAHVADRKSRHDCRHLNLPRQPTMRKTMAAHRFSSYVNRIAMPLPPSNPLTGSSGSFVAVPVLLLGASAAASQHQELYRAAYEAAQRQLRARALRRMRPSMN